MLRLVFGVAVVLWAGNAWAADQLQYAPPAPWVRPLPIPKPSPASAGTATQRLLEDLEDYFGPDGDDSYEEFADLIQTPQGLTNIGNVVLSWRPDVESLTIHKLHIVRNGQVIDLLAGGQTFLVLRRENNLEMAMLDGALTAAIQPEGLQVGDVLNFSFTLRRHDPVLQGRSERLLRDPVTSPVTHLRLRELWPASKTLRWRETEGLAAAKLNKTAGESELVVDMADAEPPRIPKDAPARFNDVGQLEVSEFSNWAEISALMAPLYEKAARLPPGSPLKSEAAKIMAQSKDAKARAAAALRLVQDKVRYLFLGMDHGGYVPAEADRTWARRFGDCKGKTVLLLALLHEMGIEAEPTLANSGHGDGLDARLPLLAAFDHVFVRAQIGGKTYWMDGTRTGDTSLDDLEVPPFYWTLPVQPSGAVLEKLDTRPYDRPEILTELKVDASAGIDAPAPVHAEQTLRGDEATMLRIRLGNKSHAEGESLIRAFWIDRYDWVDIKTVDFAFDETTGLERLSMDGTAKMDWKTYRGESGPELLIDDSRLGWKDDFTRDPGPHQDAPFKVRYPYFEKSIETVTLPAGGAGFSIDGADIDRATGGYAFARTARIDKGIFTMTATTKSLAPEFAAADAPSVKAALQELWDKALYLRAPTTSRTAHRDAAPSDGKTASFDDLLASATAAVDAHDFDRAIADLTRALAFKPDSVSALAMRGITYLQKQDWSHGAVDIESAIQLDPKDPYALRGKAAIDFSQKHYQDAVDLYSRLIAQYPEDPLSYIGRGQAYAAMRNTDKALADYNVAMRLSPDNPSAYYMRAQLFLSQNNANSALGDATKLTELLPKEAATHALLAYVLEMLNRNDEAYREYDAAITLKPDAAAYLGRAHTGAQRAPDQVLADINRAIQLKPDFFEAYEARANFDLAMRDFPDAITALNEALRLRPDDESSIRKRAKAFAGNRQFDLAVRDITQLLSVSPNASYDLESRCRYKGALGRDVSDALADCTAAAKLQPNSDEIVETRAFVNLSFGRLALAQADYDAVLVRRPNSAIAHFGRGLTELRGGSEDRGIADLIAARQANARIDTDLSGYLRAPAGYAPTDARMVEALKAASTPRQVVGAAYTPGSATSSPSPDVTVVHRPLSIVRPEYPLLAEEAQIGGYVDFEFTVEADGSVTHPVVNAEVPEAYGLADAARKVFPAWKFPPVTVDGVAVPRRAYYRFSFKLAH